MSFERPVGAAADTKELEYIAALIQTTDADKEGFVDASIDARDIKYHLMSRYGIKISKEQVRSLILSGLGGGEDEDDCLDLSEIVAALLIPFLRKIVHDSSDLSIRASSYDTDSPEGSLLKSNLDSSEPEDKDGTAGESLFFEKVPPEAILRSVLNNILSQATGSTQPQPLTKELIRSIFAAFDETVLVNDDDLVSEMIALAQGEYFEESADGPVLFDIDTFARALTSDIMLYDPEVENRCTTNFFDVFGSLSKDKKSVGISSSENFTENVENGNVEDSFTDQEGSGGITNTAVTTVKEDVMSGLSETVIADTDYGPVTKLFTFSALDFTIDNQRYVSHTLAVWFGFIAFFFNFFYSRQNPNVCGDDSFGCRIAQSVFNWTILMLLLCIVGVVYFAVIGSGNDVYRNSLLDVFVGVAGVVFFMILPLFIKFDAKIFSTDVNSDGGWFHVMMMVVFITVTSIALINQCRNAIRLLFSDSVIGSSKILSRTVAGSNTNDELSFKRAAVFKVNKMLDNAYMLHHQDRSDSSKIVQSDKGTHDLALLNFTKISDKRETAGGFLWAWKSFFNGELKSKEGIWLQTRLFAGMLAQLLLIIFIILAYSFVSSWIISFFDESEPVPVEECSITFDPTDCFAPEYDGTKVGVMACTGVIASNGCAFYEVEGDLLETTCDYLPLNPFTNSSFCEDFDVFQPVGEYAMASGEQDCSAAVTACVIYDVLEEDGSYTYTGACLLGLDPSTTMPYQFIGAGCDNLSPIDDILNTMPPFLSRAENMVDTAQDTLDWLKPEKWMVVLSLTMGLIVGILVGFAIFIYYLPSTVTTVLKFRSGVIPSLRDSNFVKYRKSLEGVTYIVGLMAWGALSSVAVVVWIVVGIVFLLVWEPTRPFVINIIAVVIGITVTLVFKTLLITVLGKLNYAAFYRKRPWVGNVCGVALECWHLGLTTGYILARTVKLIIAASMYIGRIDKPFMADDAGIIGPVDLDQFPQIYRKGLLSADAHRHPYLERLGVMYLMKIKHGSKFATTAGSIWRLLFVFSLMPWLRKYRIADDADLPEELLMQQLGQNEKTKYEETIKELRDANRTLMEENRKLKDAVEEDTFIS